VPLKTPAVWKLPVFILELLRPVFSNNFVKVSFDKMTSAELILKEKKISDTNPMKMMKKLIHGLQNIPSMQLDEIDMPVLVIHGVNDGLIPHSASRKALENLPDMQFRTVEDASHLCILEKPDEINMMIQEFVNKI